MEEEGAIIPYQATDLTGHRVLVFAPHPDDETIGCGGALALHAAAGDPVRVVVMTDGARGDSTGTIPGETYVRTRQEETLRGCAVLGVSDVVFWAYGDRALSRARGCVPRILEELRSYGPGLVYVPSLLEYHPDHRAACVFFWDALRSFEGDLRVAFYEVDQPLRPNGLVDITPVIALKTRALACFSSQLSERRYDELTLGLNRFRSATLPEGVSHAEGFSLWPSESVRLVGPYALTLQGGRRLLPAQGESGPLVSILVRTKDRPHLLSQALESVACQTYAHIEAVVVNDGGCNVQGVAEAALGPTGVPLVYVSHPQTRGRSAAANSGLAAARGLFLNFLDDDDVLFPEHVETLMACLETRAEKIAYAGVESAFFEGPPETPGSLVRKERVFVLPYDPERLLFRNYIPIMSVCFHREVPEAIGGFSEDLDLFEDWDFWLRASRRFPFHHVPKVTAQYRFYGAESAEALHRKKYAYEKAEAKLFDRALPFLDGEIWLRFLKSDLYRGMVAPQGSADALAGLLRDKERALSEALQREEGLRAKVTALDRDLARRGLLLDRAEMALSRAADLLQSEPG